MSVPSPEKGSRSNCFLSNHRDFTSNSQRPNILDEYRDEYRDLTTRPPETRVEVSDVPYSAHSGLLS